MQSGNTADREGRRAASWRARRLQGRNRSVRRPGDAHPADQQATAQRLMVFRSAEPGVSRHAAGFAW